MWAYTVKLVIKVTHVHAIKIIQFKKNILLHFILYTIGNFYEIDCKIYLSVYMMNHIAVTSNTKENKEAHFMSNMSVITKQITVKHHHIIFIIRVSMILDNLIFKAFAESRLHMINVNFIFSYRIFFIHEKNTELYLHKNAYASCFSG